MEPNFEGRLIKKDIKKIKKAHIDNIFSSKLNNNIVGIIMNYLDKNTLLEMAKTCTFIFNSFIDYENSLLRSKMEKMAKTRTCELLLENKKQGFGFFAKIPFSLKVLIVNINLIKESILGKSNKIRIKIDNIEKEIDLNNRIIKINEDPKISIIEILDESDDINDFFEYDDNTSQLNSSDSICVFNGQKDTIKNIIYGFIKKDEKGKETFIYSSQNNNILFGSPIMSLKNDKIIGIHKKFHKQINEVNLLDYPIDSFIKEKTFSKTSQKLLGAPRLRVFKELSDYNKRKNNHYNINPRNGDLSIWDITLFGPENTPYENGKFIFEVYFPSDYPAHSRGPKFIFKTKIYHPNFRGGGQRLTCCNLAEFEYWEPRYTICNILDKIYNLLKTPIPDPNENCPNVNQECSILMTTNYKKYIEKAKNWTKEFAI